MDGKKTIKISLSTFFLVIAIFVIIVMGMYLYIQKTNSDKTIAELENSNSDMEATIDNLQNKIDTIANTIGSSTNNINNKSDNTHSSSNNLSTENNIKELFLAKLKKITNNNSEKLLDYKVDNVKILSNIDKQSLIELGYSSDDILAYVTYSIKPENIETSSWITGNGEIEGDWIINKIACECLRNGKLVNNSSINTGW